MNFPQVALAQVDTVYADEGKIGVVFPNLSMLSGIRVQVAGPGRTARSGTFTLPVRGDWGLVAFFQNDVRSCVWLTTLSDTVWNSAPLETWKDDPRAAVTYTPDGTQRIRHGNGDVEQLHPDGTLLRLTHSKDGTVGNAGGRARRTARKVTEPAGAARTPTRRPYTPRQRAPLDVVIEHASGAVVRLTADGSLSVKTARGHELRLHDATEKAREAQFPHDVMATPEEDASRVASVITLTTEVGHTITMKDDPVLAADRFVRVQTAGGHALTLRDLPAAQQGVKAVTAGGLMVDMLDLTKTITVTGETVVVNASLAVKLGSAGASRKVVLDGDSGSDPQGGSVTVSSTATKVYAE